MNNDLISRQQAIDALRTCYDTETITMDNGDEYINYGDAVGEIEQLPPIQSEIIRCRECKFASGDSRICMKFDHSTIGELDFCSFAERREVNNESD